MIGETIIFGFLHMLKRAMTAIQMTIIMVKERVLNPFGSLVLLSMKNTATAKSPGAEQVIIRT